MKKILRGSVVVILVLVGGVAIFIPIFNRVPDRTIPAGQNIVSPANGRIIHIETVAGREISFFKKDIENTLTINNIEPPYTIVVIELSLEDIHAQRAPIAGEIIYQEHFAGAHKNALWSSGVKTLANVNEKNVIVIENQDIAVGVIQVAGIAARRIQSFVETGTNVTKGQVYGRILLGSQVVMVIPAAASVVVDEGDELIDGETVIANYTLR